MSKRRPPPSSWLTMILPLLLFLLLARPATTSSGGGQGADAQHLQQNFQAAPGRDAAAGGFGTAAVAGIGNPAVAGTGTGTGSTAETIPPMMQALVRAFEEANGHTGGQHVGHGQQQQQLPRQQFGADGSPPLPTPQGHHHQHQQQQQQQQPQHHPQQQQQHQQQCTPQQQEMQSRTITASNGAIIGKVQAGTSPKQKPRHQYQVSGRMLNSLHTVTTERFIHDVREAYEAAYREKIQKQKQLEQQKQKEKEQSSFSFFGRKGGSGVKDNDNDNENNNQQQQQQGTYLSRIRQTQTELQDILKAIDDEIMQPSDEDVNGVAFRRNHGRAIRWVDILTKALDALERNVALDLTEEEEEAREEVRALEKEGAVKGAVAVSGGGAPQQTQPQAQQAQCQQQQQQQCHQQQQQQCHQRHQQCQQAQQEQQQQQSQQCQPGQQCQEPVTSATQAKIDRLIKLINQLSNFPSIEAALDSSSNPTFQRNQARMYKDGIELLLEMRGLQNSNSNKIRVFDISELDDDAFQNAEEMIKVLDAIIEEDELFFEMFRQEQDQQLLLQQEEEQQDEGRDSARNNNNGDGRGVDLLSPILHETMPAIRVDDPILQHPLDATRGTGTIHDGTIHLINDIAIPDSLYTDVLGEAARSSDWPAVRDEINRIYLVHQQDLNSIKEELIANSESVEELIASREEMTDEMQVALDTATSLGEELRDTNPELIREFQDKSKTFQEVKERLDHERQELDERSRNLRRRGDELSRLYKSVSRRLDVEEAEINRLKQEKRSLQDLVRQDSMLLGQQQQQHQQQQQCGAQQHQQQQCGAQQQLQQQRCDGKQNQQCGAQSPQQQQQQQDPQAQPGTGRSVPSTLAIVVSYAASGYLLCVLGMLFFAPDMKKDSKMGLLYVLGMFFFAPDTKTDGKVGTSRKKDERDVKKVRVGGKKKQKQTADRAVRRDKDAALTGKNDVKTSSSKKKLTVPVKLNVSSRKKSDASSSNEPAKLYGPVVTTTPESVATARASTLERKGSGIAHSVSDLGNEKEKYAVDAVLQTSLSTKSESTAKATPPNDAELAAIPPGLLDEVTEKLVPSAIMVPTNEVEAVDRDLQADADAAAALAAENEALKKQLDDANKALAELQEKAARAHRQDGDTAAAALTENMKLKKQLEDAKKELSNVQKAEVKLKKQRMRAIDDSKRLQKELDDETKNAGSKEKEAAALKDAFNMAKNALEKAAEEAGDLKRQRDIMQSRLDSMMEDNKRLSSQIDVLRAEKSFLESTTSTAAIVETGAAATTTGSTGSSNRSDGNSKLLSMMGIRAEGSDSYGTTSASAFPPGFSAGTSNLTEPKQTDEDPDYLSRIINMSLAALDSNDDVEK